MFIYTIMDDEACSVADSVSWESTGDRDEVRSIFQTITSRTSSLTVIFDKLVTGDVQPKEEIEDGPRSEDPSPAVECMESEEISEDPKEVSGQVVTGR